MMSSSHHHHHRRPPQQPEIIEKYFSSINPIASKIHHDINETKLSYEHIWNELNHSEQTDIINETLIKPEIALRYFNSCCFTPTARIVAAAVTKTTPSSSSSTNNDDPDESSAIYLYDGRHLETYSNQKTALKFINDDIIGVFRDEHSAPFSFKTKSQINLNLFHNNGTVNQTIAQNQLQSTATVLKPTSIGGDDCVKTTVTNPIPKNQLKIIAEAAASASSTNNKPPPPPPPTLVKQITATTTANNNKKYERFYNDPSTIGGGVQNEEDDDNFINKFICKNNLIYNKNSANDSQLVIVASNLYDRVDDDDDDGSSSSCGGRNFEKKILVKDIGERRGDGEVGDLNSTLSLHSEEDDDKHVYEDSKLLLETSADDLRKGFDFLNNW